MFSCQGRPMAVHHSKVIKVFQCPFMCSSGSILTMLMLTPLHLLPPFLPISTCLHFSHETALCWLSTGGSLPQWTPLPPPQNCNAHCSKEINVDIVDVEQPSPVFTFLTRPHNVLTMMCLRLSAPVGTVFYSKLYDQWERGH